MPTVQVYNLLFFENRERLGLVSVGKFKVSVAPPRGGHRRAVGSSGEGGQEEGVDLSFVVH